MTVQSAGRALNGLRRPETEQGPLGTGLGQKLDSAGSLDHDRGEIENGIRGDPDHTALASEPTEHVRATDRYYG